MKQQAFYNYLKQEGLKESTIKGDIKELERFMLWAKQNNSNQITTITYNELLNYVKYIKAKGVSIATINIRIRAVRKYFDYLKTAGIITTNPAKKLYIKGTVKKVIQHPLSTIELDQLYHQYEKPKATYREEKVRTTHQRNVIILGLMIWQGIHAGELKKLETNHINLTQGSIYIPSTSRSNSRKLPLQPQQILTIHQYINNTNIKTGYLINANPHPIIYSIINQLKGINPIVKNAGHIRASVILNWLKIHNKRKVQTMIGHKYISSTEHYEVQELEGLTNLLEQHHPFS